MARESEMMVSLVQEVDLLPPGYQDDHHEALTLLEDRFDLVSELLAAKLERGLTTNTEGDDEDEGDAQYLPATDIFPAIIMVSSPDLRMPDIRDEVIDLVNEGLGEVVERLPFLALVIQFPPDN